MTNGYLFREDTHKKVFFFSGRTTKVLHSLHQWLGGPCHFFFFSYNSLKRIFWAKKGNFFWQILFSNQ